jgi:hypothetical protein
MLRILLAIILSAIVIGCRAHAGDPRQEFLTLEPSEKAFDAWWLRAEFHPFETQVRGIPIQRIRSKWCRATEFRRDLFPPDLEFDDDLFFAVDGFFDGSKMKQTALVGVYESCAGVKGSFLLILGWPRQGRPTIRFIEEFRSERQFAILRAQPDSSIIVWNCMSCDNASQLKWDRSKRRFVWVPSDF